MCEKCGAQKQAFYEDSDHTPTLKKEKALQK
jgi:hypothetical protein